MRKIALCIGNDEYSFLPKLKYAVSDATEIEKNLKLLGFETILKINLCREDLVDTIFDFCDRIEQYDAILVYYAGHGFQIEGDNIIAPIDLNINTRTKSVKYDAFPIADLMKQLNNYPTQTKIVILDACRENLNNRGGIMDFAPILAPQGSIIAFSTSPGQSSRESEDKKHGIYTSTLLKYIGLPRVQIETVFKKVRETMIAETGGIQIPWEHTSLIGDFYLNSDTIYDGIFYSNEALADGEYKIFQDEKIKNVVTDLKSYNWPTQERGINEIYTIDYSNASSNDLFVLGRNVYQAADGSSFSARNFIDYFCEHNQITSQAKMHILNGMVYEIYFDSTNNIRKRFKLGYYERIIAYVEKKEFYSSKEFIVSKLCKEDNRILYIPGQNELMEFTVILEKNNEDIYVKDVIYHGKSVLNNIDFSYRISIDSWCSYTIYQFEKSIADTIVALQDYVKIEYNGSEVTRDTILQIPQRECQCE